eukprot:15807093-Heterocapsa_arctica.AAC.1
MLRMSVRSCLPALGILSHSLGPKISAPTPVSPASDSSPASSSSTVMGGRSSASSRSLVVLFMSSVSLATRSPAPGGHQ